MNVMASTLVTQGEAPASIERKNVGMKLGDLPEACIAAILAFTSSSDVARLASVNRTFRDASTLDTVWQKMLPARYEEIIAQVSRWHPKNTSKREIYNFLCNGSFRQNDNREIWLDKASGGVCISVGSRALQFLDDEDLPYWSWVSYKSRSRYPEVARLHSTWQLDVRGRWQCHLPPGQYALSWRVCMAFSPSSDEWRFRPVKFTFKANSRLVSTECYLMENDEEQREFPLLLGLFYNTWMDINVGEFTVEKGDSAVELSFSMTEIEGGHLKSGLCLDCVQIRPTSVKRAVVQPRNFLQQEESKWRKLRQQEKSKWLEQQEESEWREMQKMMFK